MGTDFNWSISVKICVICEQNRFLIIIRSRLVGEGNGKRHRITGRTSARPYRTVRSGGSDTTGGDKNYKSCNSECISLASMTQFTTDDSRFTNR